MAPDAAPGRPAGAGESTEPTEPDERGEAEGPELPTACAAVRDALYRRADGEALAPREAHALDAHLGRCESCAAELRRAGEFSTHISKLLGELRPAADMRRKVLDRIGPLAGRRRTTILGAAALGVAALVGLLVLVLARESPVARVASAEGDVRVLAFSAGAWRPRDRARDVFAGERIEAAPGTAAEIEGPGFRAKVAGPAFVQLARGTSGEPVIHCLKETTLAVEAMPGRAMGVRVAGVRLRAADARFALSVDGAGACRLEVERGVVRSRDAGGERAVGAGEAVDLVQPEPAGHAAPIP